MYIKPLEVVPQLTNVLFLSSLLFHFLSLFHFEWVLWVYLQFTVTSIFLLNV